jgi:glycine/D-amino acid oxidase-like deaminating enzyme
METYLFHVRRHNHRIPDPEGSELPDDQTAVEYARAAAKELARESLKKDEQTGTGSIEVVTTDGRYVASVVVCSTVR